MEPSPASIPIKPNRERLSGAKRRTAILEASISLFASRGFRGTTTREIAAAVAVTEPVLYQHFETKRALYDAILEARCLEAGTKDVQAIHEAASSDDIRVFFTQLAGLFLDWYLTDPRYARLLMYASLENNQLSQMFYDRQVVVFHERVTGYLNRQMTSGRVRTMNPLIAARAFAGMLSHHGLIYSIYCPGELTGGRDGIISTVIDIFLQGIENGAYE